MFLPDVPTVAESGFPSFDVSVWFGVAAPAGTPAPVLASLNAEINRILSLPDVERLLARVHTGSCSLPVLLTLLEALDAVHSTMASIQLDKLSRQARCGRNQTDSSIG